MSAGSTPIRAETRASESRKGSSSLDSGPAAACHASGGAVFGARRPPTILSPIPACQGTTAGDNDREGLRASGVYVARSGRVLEDVAPWRPAAPRRRGFADDAVYAAHDLVRIAADLAGIRVSYLCSPRINGRTVKARLIAYWLLDRYTLMSRAAIGRFLGNRDRKTISTGISRAEQAVIALDVPITDDPCATALLLWSGTWPSALERAR